MEIFGIGLGEMLLIAIVAMVILGPDRLPDAARQLGRFIGDIRRATEPARSALQEITSEISRAADSATTIVNQKPTGNPWDIHPVMQGMTDEEREQFTASGDMPERLADQANPTAAFRVASNGNTGEPLDSLSYPMPHTDLSSSTPGAAATDEILDYPLPGA